MNGLSRVEYLESLRTADPRERFWSKVDRSGGPSACWPWTSAFKGQGYREGRAYGGFSLYGKYVSAHRLAYELSIAPIPDDLHVMHLCDEPSCCNPLHMSLGTAADNLGDMALKGRGTAGGLPFGVKPRRMANGVKYRARIVVNGKEINCGTYDTPEGAGRAALSRKLEIRMDGPDKEPLR